MYSQVVQEQERERGRESRGMMAGREGEKERERERESAKIYNMQTVGYCSQSHLEWKTSFPFGEECRRDGLLWLQTTDSSNVKRTEITDWKQRALDF